MSQSFNVTSSVAQGSHLGPLLFLLFINDIIKHLNIDFCFYADDLKIYKRIEDLSDAFKLQENLEAFSSYCKVNKLNLNIKKCTTMSFTRRTTNKINFYYNVNGCILQKVSEMKDLGVQINQIKSTLFNC